jgi:hypothetical protein
MTTTMPSTIPSSMTPEMNEILYKSISKPPTSQEDRVKYLVASLTRTVVKHADYFKYFFFNDIEDFKTLANWVDRKTKGEPFTDDEMLGLKALNSGGMAYFGLLTFKAISLGIFNKEQFYEDTDTPKPVRKYTPLKRYVDDPPKCYVDDVPKSRK